MKSTTIILLFLVTAIRMRAREELVLAGSRIEKAVVIVDTRGHAHIVSDQGLNGRKVFYSYPVSGEWNTIELHPGNRPAGITTEPHFALGTHDTAWVGLHTTSPTDRRDATVSFYRIDHLSTKPEVGPLTQSVRGTRTHLVTYRNGDVYVLWRMGADLFYAVYDAQGKNPSPVRRLTNVKLTVPDEEMGQCSNSFDFDVGPDGLVHGVCTNILGLMYGNARLEAADRGVQMIARGHEVGCEGPYTVPVIRVDRANPDVVYVLFAGVENKAYLILKTPAGWRRPFQVAPGGRNQSARRAPPFLAAVPGGGAIAAWMDSRNGDPTLFMRWIGIDGRSGPEVQVATGKHPRFAIDARGMLHFTYTRAGNLYYSQVTAPPRPERARPAPAIP